MGRKIILGSLIVLFMALTVPNVIAASECSTPSCHQEYYNAINAKQHSGSDGCIYCHTSSYYPTHSGYVGYIVNESNTCSQGSCHSNTSGYAARPIYERHSSSSDCTTCHFANTTVRFDKNSSLFKHDHNFTVEYNFYYYNISGIPIKKNNGVGKGMFPYYACTLTCHEDDHGLDIQKIDDAAESWLNSSHARSRHGNETYDSKNSCAKCKSPPNYNVSASSSAAITEADWQGIQCRVCHNLHDRKFPNNTGVSGFPIAFYNSTKSSQNGAATYEQLTNSTQLCEDCHTGSTHDSKFAGYHKDTLGFNCTNCHMNSTFNDELHKFEVKNTTSNATGCEVCHNAQDHTFKFTSIHENEVTCEACHDNTVARNNSDFVVNVSAGMDAGLYKDPTTNKWTTYKLSYGTPASWPLHNISRSIDCDKCHGGLSVFNGTIAPSFGNDTGCGVCHSSYAAAFNSTKHNQTLTMGAPGCTYCHSGYENIANHTTGNSSFIVNESNTCRNCHVEGLNLNESHGNHGYGQNYADCTQCHFANTTQIFNATALTFTHDHNLTVEYNYYNYNLSGIPLESDHSASKKGMFPYYTCTLTCHDGTGGGQPKIENETRDWSGSGHAQIPNTFVNWTNRTVTSSTSPLKGTGCLICKSPTQFDASIQMQITAEDWQGIQCRICHNLHNDTYSGNGTPINNIAYYNGTKSNLTGSPVYDIMENATVLCEKCHTGYHNAIAYGGFHKNNISFTCADCHMNSTVNNGSTHTFDVSNSTSGLTGCEACHDATSEHLANFSQYWVHENIVACDSCHDATLIKNSSNYVVSTGTSGGIYKNTTTNKWTTYRGSRSAADWAFHNTSKNVTCDKCHGGISSFNGSIAPALTGETGCAQCHPIYVNAVNSSRHNRTTNSAAPNCTLCHTGYDTVHTGYIVNESNTCRNCHNSTSDISLVNESHGNHNFGQDYSDCTQCHFANTTQTFGLNTSLHTHDHNLTVEYNFYNYNISGMPLSTNGGVGKGMFPYYTCTLTCHNGSVGGQPMIENESIAWRQSGHGHVTQHGSRYNSSCLKCHSPPMYNQSSGATITASIWQDIQCRVCHNLHNDTYSGNGTPPINTAFYNATLSSLAGTPVYNTVETVTELCEKCHNGSDRHATDRDIYYKGSHKTSLGFTCANCHMNSTINNGSEHSFAINNTATGETGCEACHVAASVHTDSNFREYSSHGNVTCDACHDGSFERNSTDYVVNVSTGMVNGGIYKNTLTNKWTTYRGTTSATDWAFHNISKNITCDKCHGGLSPLSGAIAPNLTSGGVTYYTTDTLISGYKFILVLLYPQPPIYANYLINSSLSGVPGVNKTLNWNSTAQEWEGYENINGVYLGTNFTVSGFASYMVKGNSLSVSKAYTFKGSK